MRRPTSTKSLFERFMERLRYFLALSLFNVFPLPRQSGFLRSFRFAGNLVDRRWNLLVFPEGRTTEDGKMAPFRSGIGLLAKQLGIPVVPVNLDGLYDLKQAERIITRPGHVRVTIGSPIRFSREEDSDTITRDRKSTRLNSSHSQISYAVFCLKHNHSPFCRLHISSRHALLDDGLFCHSLHRGVGA